jgi:polar amino acid transport system permease protein
MNASVIIGRLLESSLINLELFAVTLLLGLPLGLIIAFGSMSRFTPLRWLSQTFV